MEIGEKIALATLIVFTISVIVTLLIWRFPKTPPPQSADINVTIKLLLSGTENYIEQENSSQTGEEQMRIRLLPEETVQEDNIVSIRATNISEGDRLAVYIQALPSTIDYSTAPLSAEAQVQLKAFWSENDHWASENKVRDVRVDLANCPHTTVENGVLGRMFNIDGLMSETMYQISVVRLIPNPENPQEYTADLPKMGAIRISTTMLRNLQRYEIFDSQRAENTLPSNELINQAAIPANTHDTVHFNILFLENPEYLARFDINGDGVVCSLDVTALQGYVNGDTAAMIGDEITTVEYKATNVATPVVTEVKRGDINKDGVVNQADVNRLADILASPARPTQNLGVVVFILTRDNFLAGNTSENYRLRQLAIYETPELKQDTLLTNLSFTGLQPDTEYTIVALVGQHNGWRAPCTRSTTVRTAQEP